MLFFYLQFLYFKFFIVILIYHSYFDKYDLNNTLIIQLFK